MPNANPGLMTIVGAALELADPAARAAYLDRACGGDAQLRQQVEVRLAAHANAGRSLESEPSNFTGAYVPDDGADAQADASERVSHSTPADGTSAYGIGSVIAGRYRLVEVIGEGGMGSVYRAEQSEPVKRQVALKLIKSGMDSKTVLVRFEAERQALALMDHPNIARVYDGGTTPWGQPFFVMELVQGVPITEFCDTHRMSVNSRLELFVLVCQAVQHAHQKGIIHRDLKPGNVLVTEVDGLPTPKVIDFGVAKATEQKLTDQSYADTSAIVGTPAYMSPEQADPSSMDIDTRTDVYALGVILYELLVGSPPIEAKQFKRGALLEMLRMVREVDPPRPSTRLSTDDARPSIAANRAIEPAQLTKLLRNELDWIVLKALEKDRTRRYETANGFSRDLQRYLADEPVEARPPSRSYRLRKFVRRNRGQVVAASLVLLALVGGIVGTTWGMVRANAAAENARLAKVDADERRQEAVDEKQISEAVRYFLLNKLLIQASTWAQADDLMKAGQSSAGAKLNPTIRELLDRAALELTPEAIEGNFPRQLKVQAELLYTIGLAYQSVSELRTAETFLRRAAELHRRIVGADHIDTLLSESRLAENHHRAGRTAEAIQLYEQVHRALVKNVGPDHTDALAILRSLGQAYLLQGRRDDAIRAMEQARAGLSKNLAPDDPQMLLSALDLAQTYRVVGRVAEAIRLYEEIRPRQEAKQGAEHPDTLTMLAELAQTYTLVGRHTEAIALLERVRDLDIRQLGAEHMSTHITIGLLATAVMQSGRPADAIPVFEQAIKGLSKSLGADHRFTLMAQSSLGVALTNTGRPTDAIRLLEQVRDPVVKNLGADHPDTLLVLNNLALAQLAAGKTADAVPFLEQIRDLQTKRLGADHPETLGTRNNLAEAYRTVGRIPDAIALHERLRAVMAKTLGADHPNTITQLDNLARVYRLAGRAAEAIPVSEQVRDILVKKRGADHPDTLTALNNLALAYQTAGRTAEAIPIYERVRDARMKTLGAEHPHTLLVIDNLATSYRSAGRTAEAIQLFEQVRDGRTKRLGAEHADTLTTLNGLALAYQAAGRTAEAIPLYEHVRAVRVKTLGADHPSTLITIENLALAYQNAGKLTEAIALFEQAATSVEKRQFVNQYAERLIDRTALAYEAAQQYDQAATWRRKWLAFVKQRDGAEAPLYANGLANVAANLLLQHQWIEAEAVIRESLAIREKKSPDQWRTFNSYSQLGAALLGQKKYADAEPLLLKGYEGMQQRAKGIPPIAPVRLHEALGRLVELYTAWHAAEPGQGYDAKAVEWKAKLPTEPAPPPMK